MQDDDKEFVREFFEDVEKRYKKEWDDFLAKVGGYSNLVELTREMEELYRTNAYAQRDLTRLVAAFENQRKYGKELGEADGQQPTSFAEKDAKTRDEGWYEERK